MNSGPTKRERQKAILEIIVREGVGSQQELADRLIDRGIAVTQATVGRDIAELGLIKVARGDRHVYVSPEDVGPPPRRVSDERLRRILEDIPVTVGRSGLILLVTGSPGTASVIAQAIDDSNLTEQALIAHCRQYLGGYKCPRGVTFRDEPLPLTGPGKIRKNELRAALRAQAGKS